jgi:uncharacterized protein (DUF1684 family)
VHQASNFTKNGFSGPAPYQLADWRLQVQSLYAVLRSFDDPADAWELWKARRNELLATHPCSPLSDDQKRMFRGAKVFNYDPALRFEVDIADEKGTMQFQDLGVDGQVHFQQIGKTIGLAHALGKELSVFWMLGYGGGLFIPFRDATAGDTTFRTGRVLVDSVKGADLGLSRNGKLVLDFNFSYHPCKVWNSKFDYISVPDENHLSCAVQAGECQ